MTNDSFHKLPKYSELDTIGPNREHHAWDYFGKGDELGTLNLLTPERVKLAAQLVRKGKVIPLSLPRNQPDPDFTTRTPCKRVVIKYPAWREDSLDNFHTHHSSHWDALSHKKDVDLGYYGGLQDDDVDTKLKLGIDKFVEHGVVGRGILLDVFRYREMQGMASPPNQAWAITPRDLEAVARTQKVEFRLGDILLIRTGMLKNYLSLDNAGREALGNTLREEAQMPGIEGSREMAAFLWDHGVSAIAADCQGVERISGYVDLPMHTLLLVLLGMPLGELWNLEALAADCAGDGVYEFMLVSVPLYVPGGHGSPCNAIAIK